MKIFLKFFVTFIFSCSASQTVLANSELARFFGAGVPKYQFDYGNEIGEAACEGKVLQQSGPSQTLGPTHISPSKIAVRGLEAAIRGNFQVAEICAEQLEKISLDLNGAVFFPYKDVSADFWIYALQAPWTSALTQGAALGLFDKLAQSTGKEKYRTIADGVYRSYMVPLQEGGFARRTSDDMVLLEEYPSPDVVTAVMNGGVVATLALIDHLKISDDPKGRALLSDVIRWWENNIHSYNVLLSAEEGQYGSSYSLAPNRLNIDFRFFLQKGSVDVYSLSLKSSDEMHALDIKESRHKRDGSKDRPLVLEYACPVWSEPIIDTKSDVYRAINLSGNECGQAKFSLHVFDDRQLEYLKDKAEIKILYRSKGDIDLQISDGLEYYKIGTLSSTRGKLISRKFEIPKAAFSRIEYPKKNFVNENYLDDNQLLMGILAEASSSAVLNHYAKNWKGSESFVPFDSMSEPPNLPIVYEEREPILALLPSPSEESLHVEYPVVYGKNGGTMLLYAAYGDDRRWRIKLATKSDKAWLRQGRIFDESLLDFEGNYAFPYVVENVGSIAERYVLYFSASKNMTEPYTMLLRSISRDGVAWSAPVKVLEDEIILDPVVEHAKSGDSVTYTSRQNGGDVIRQANIPYGKSRIVYRPQGSVMGIYTIGSLKLKGRTVYVLEQGRKKRVDWSISCVGSNGEFVNIHDGPVAVFSRGDQAWNTIRYGQYFIDENSQNIGMYFNGILSSGAEKGGQIGYAVLSREAFEKNISIEKCQKK